VSRRSLLLPLIAYFLTLAAFLASSFFPDSRLWGLNGWAWFPLWVRFSLLGIGLLIGGAIWRWQDVLDRTADLPGRPDSPRPFLMIISTLTGCLMLLFYLGRARTHFLGDGYLELTALVTPASDIMYREIGETLAHSYLYSFLSGAPPERALDAYQIISITAGFLFLVVLTLAALRLMAQTRDRMLYVLATISGGFLLLFFGYVEHYSLFSVAVAAIVLCALLVLGGKLKPIWLLPLLAFGLFLHMLTLILLPAVLAVYLSRTKFGSWYAARDRTAKIGLLALLASPAVALIIYFFATNLFFRLAFVPPLAHCFTAEGYTLFSPAHLADWLNLIVIHMPGILVLVAGMVGVDCRALLREPPYRFLAFLLVCAWGAAFVLDPKLGMPRDWDLFSFAGLPLVLAAAYLYTDPGHRPARAVGVLLLGAALGLLSLGPRVAVQAIPSAGLEQIHSYIQLDRIKNKNAVVTLRNYHLGHGDPHAAAEVLAIWNSYPEGADLERADTLGRGGQNGAALRALNEAISKNPLFAPSYLHLGQMLNRLGQYDSAITVLQIAYGLSPRNPAVNSALGYALWWAGHKREGRERCEAAIAFNPEIAKPYYFLANISREEGNNAEYERLLVIAAGKADATAPMFCELGDLLAGRGEFSAAALQYRRALDKGLDASDLRARLAKYPPLKDLLPDK